MIVSHKYKFIFIKTNKTAGSSIEIGLSAHCGERDILSRCLPGEAELRKSLGYRLPQNNLVPFKKYTLRNWLSFAHKWKRKEFSSHTSAREIRRILGESIWNEYYKFCFERNPWDRVVSLYYFMLYRNQANLEPSMTISEFINSRKVLSLKKWGIDNYTINGEIAVDRVCKYEHLEKELEEVCESILGMPRLPELPRAKGEARTDRRHYRDILSNTDRQKIAELFAREIELFGYEF